MTDALALPALQDPPRAVEWLTHLLPSLRHDQAAREAAGPVVADLMRPADTTWTMARIAALLNPYFDRETPHSVRVMEAEDWAEALAVYPQWAIEKAVRWWKSEDNQHRRKRPLEGDIGARCKIEVDVVRAAQMYLSRPVTVSAKPAPAPEPVTAEAANEILAKYGFAPKRMGGGNRGSFGDGAPDE